MTTMVEYIIILYISITGEQTDSDYLDTSDGHEYILVFKHIRLIHILTDSGSVSVINTDRIIPRGFTHFSSTLGHYKLNGVFNRLAVSSV